MPSWCFKSLICKETTLTGLAVTTWGGGGKRTYCYVLTFVYRIHCYILTLKVSVWALNINIYIHTHTHTHIYIYVKRLPLIKEDIRRKKKLFLQKILKGPEHLSP